MPVVQQLTKSRLITNFDLSFTIDESGKVEVPLKWEADNLVNLKLPIPTKITTHIRVHKRAAPVFEEWFRSFRRQECECILTFGGSFVPRIMRGANLPDTSDYTRDWAPFLSRHSRGIAMDFNPEQNRRSTPGAKQGEIGWLGPIIEKARTVHVPIIDPFHGTTWEAGIVCGADWGGKMIDPMHFEIGEWR